MLIVIFKPRVEYAKEFDGDLNEEGDSKPELSNFFRTMRHLIPRKKHKSGRKRQDGKLQSISPSRAVKEALWRKEVHKRRGTPSGSDRDFQQHVCKVLRGRHFQTARTLG